MVWENSNFITELDLGIAYRKAKADLYYERDHPNSFALCEYESQLESNLTRLLERFQSDDLEWMTQPEFVGDWSVIPKDLDDGSKDKDSATWRPSDPDKSWQSHVGTLRPRRPAAQFRLVGSHSIDFHVTSALWMLKVGHIYDAVLGDEAFGSRIRRYRPQRDGGVGEINLDSLGSFRPYFRPFGQWRDNGLRAMRQALEDRKRVIAITADVHQFYHRTSPDFILDREYLATVDLTDKLGADELRFTEGFRNALRAWAARTPIHRSDPTVGLPVGLPAARLVANVVLAEFDRLICRGLTPLYYGRYVDDIMLVFEDKQGFQSDREVWKYIQRHVGKALRVRAPKGKLEVRFHRSYLGNGEIVFVGEKQKVFLLDGPGGIALVGSLERQVRTRASEWRALPDIPESPTGLSADIVSACGKDGEDVDNLRKAEALSTRRGALAIRLRDVEAFDHDLLPEQWTAQRKEFLSVARQHLLALPQLFDFASYIGRMFALAISCRDYEDAIALVGRLNSVIETIRADCTVGLAAGKCEDLGEGEDVLDRWRDHIGRALAEALTSGLSHAHLNDAIHIGEVLRQLKALLRQWHLPLDDASTAFLWSRRFFVHDLARAPYRLRFFHYGGTRSWRTGDIGQEEITLPGNFPFCDPQRHSCVASFMRTLSESHDVVPTVPVALLYPTRPFTVPEFYFLVPDLLGSGDKGKIAEWTLAFRGFRPSGEMPGAGEDQGSIAISRRFVPGPVHVAVSSWKTSNDSWKASAASMSDPDRTRYTRLNRLLNDVLRARNRVDYLVLPELAVPQRWFFRLANKLAARETSLIAGIEYIHHGSAKVANQVWCSLVTDFLGFPSLVIYRQDKERPALDEEKLLWDTAGRELAPLRKASKPVVRHGGFHFGVLICSELTNLEHRRRFRGRVYGLFVPEWNQDTETFSALVEASALDIHAYIIQCNDRMFGDSRIRSPAKDSWKRDIVRLRGGIEEYFVIGELDVAALRKFQSANRSPNQPFKPVPDGFEVDPVRRRLP